MKKPRNRLAAPRFFHIIFLSVSLCIPSVTQLLCVRSLLTVTSEWLLVWFWQAGQQAGSCVTGSAAEKKANGAN